jgi:hypothetical protein
VVSLVANVLLTLAYREKDEQVDRALGKYVELLDHHCLRSVQRYIAELPEDATGQLTASQELANASRVIMRSCRSSTMNDLVTGKTLAARSSWLVSSTGISR